MGVEPGREFPDEPVGITEIIRSRLLGCGSVGRTAWPASEDAVAGIDHPGDLENSLGVLALARSLSSPNECPKTGHRGGGAVAAVAA